MERSVPEGAPRTRGCSFVSGWGGDNTKARFKYRYQAPPTHRPDARPQKRSGGRDFSGGNAMPVPNYQAISDTHRAGLS